ncbi:MAG: DUF2309 domain-containing protein [Acidobacteria bacterium]|nr:DUF2309 domain-containing protein [Acidobacteriota bacterium]
MKTASHHPAHGLEHIVEHLAHLLPAQGPIGVFIHHNTLHAFQHLPFDEAVQSAARLYGNEPYMTEAAYRRDFDRGRITVGDLDVVLGWEADEPIIPFLLDRRALRRAVLLAPPALDDAAEISWWLAEGGVSSQRRQLFDACRRLFRAPAVNSAAPAHKAATPPAVRAIIDPLMIRLCGAFLDQGVAYWPMPDRQHGFLAAVRTLFETTRAVEPLPGLAAELARQRRHHWTALQTVEEMLRRLDIDVAAQEEFLRDELLALGGWAGMFYRLQEEPYLAPHERVPCSLMEYLAVRLTLVACAPRNEAVEAPAAGAEAAELVMTSALFTAADALGYRISDLEAFSRENRERFQREVLAFHPIERRRVWHVAYEYHHERDVLRPIAERLHKRGRRPVAGTPKAQVFFCIDEREESIRRHLEELDPRVETLGAAGFFGVAMDYAGIDDPHGVSLCPVVVKPQHAIREQPVAEHADLHERRRALRRLWSQFAQGALKSSRTLWLGWISTAILGLFSMFPLLIRILAPRRYGQLMARLNDLFLPEPRTEVTLMRNDEHGHHLSEGLVLGFTVAEKVDRVASVLAPAGLMTRFSRLVVVLGHGSTSLNNPHESAHDCGACGGRRGGPNARLFAAMANHPDVRLALRDRGIMIPADTWFVGGYHDTSSDEVDLYDLEQMPRDHDAELAELRATLDRARAANAHERARRFESADNAHNPKQGLEHVEARAEHLAEPRPEYGHCTNAVCVVGRRELTRGLFLDRRYFLVSYDPATDTQGQYLTRLMSAVGPVCGGISLEYYFSFVDNQRYGCGTKLPHNITGLVGVMDGHSSDLRTGLPLQMVEIHEPVRILFVVETSAEQLALTISSIPFVEEVARNCWVRFAAVDPETSQISILRPWGFELYQPEPGETPRAPSSFQWYAGHRAHLPVAEIEMAGAR